ncbi:MAG TPA: hypothetical protein VI094_06945, partial [Propionibacteriaceae bacterium]
MDAGQQSEPDDALKPSTLREISPHSWRYLARRTLHEFLRDDCLDLARGPDLLRDTRRAARPDCRYLFAR